MLTSYYVAKYKNHMDTRTAVQMRKRPGAGTVWIALRNPEEILAKREGETIRVTLDLDATAADFLDRYADHRNRIGRLQKAADIEAGRKKKTDTVTTWARKNLAESLLEGIVEDLRENIAAQVKAIGPLPDPKEASACEKYADRAFEWIAKNRG